jgi:hypothetical protein
LGLQGFFEGIIFLTLILIYTFEGSNVFIFDLIVHPTYQNKGMKINLSIVVLKKEKRYAIGPKVVFEIPYRN